MEAVIGYLLEYKYLAMFGILMLCGMGLPLPEEVTLLGSGLLVGWKEADFVLASVACGSAILLGDSVIFLLGKLSGRRFLQSRFMRWILSRKRQARVRKLFSRHGMKAVFIARFFAGVRIGVYAYAGHHGMRWYRFVLLDLMGVLISVPTSIWVGKFAGQQFGDSSEEAVQTARDLAHNLRLWFLGAAIAAIALFALWHLVRRRRRADARRARGGRPLAPAGAPSSQASTSASSALVSHVETPEDQPTR